MLMTFFEIMQQKYGREDSFSPDARTKRLTTVYLDKDRGAEINIRALGGRYYRVISGESTGWNPFSLPATKRNINFIRQLMKILCTRNGSTISPRDERRLSDAVNAVMNDEPQYRVYGITRMLENLPEPATKEARENGLSIRLSQWAQGGEFGWVFDNESDTFDISNCDNFGIDGTEFLDDASVCAPISFYLLYRITSLLDGRRLVIFMDEFWKWLRDLVFKDFAYNKLKTIRKLNGMLVVGTQSPAEIIKDDIAPAVIEQCGTQILAANPNADRTHYVDGMKFEPEVFDVVKELDPQARQYVVVKNQFRRGDTKRFAARVTLDLSGTPASLLRWNYRMNPDRILLTEVRGAEAWDFLKITGSGHEGSMTSIHAGSAKEAIDGFITRCYENPQCAQLPYTFMLRKVLDSLDVIVSIDLDGNVRRMNDIYFRPIHRNQYFEEMKA